MSMKRENKNTIKKRNANDWLALKMQAQHDKNEGYLELSMSYSSK